MKKPKRPPPKAAAVPGMPMVPPSSRAKMRGGMKGGMKMKSPMQSLKSGMPF